MKKKNVSNVILVKTNGCSFQPSINVEKETTLYKMSSLAYHFFPTYLCGSLLQYGSRHNHNVNTVHVLFFLFSVCMQLHSPAGKEPKYIAHQRFQFGPKHFEEQLLLRSKNTEEPFRRRRTPKWLQQMI